MNGAQTNVPFGVNIVKTVLLLSFCRLKCAAIVRQGDCDASKLAAHKIFFRVISRPGFAHTVIITDSDHVILSAIQSETIANRVSGDSQDSADEAEDSSPSPLIRIIFRMWQESLFAPYSSNSFSQPAIADIAVEANPYITQRAQSSSYRFITNAVFTVA